MSRAPEWRRPVFPHCQKKYDNVYAICARATLCVRCGDAPVSSSSPSEVGRLTQERARTKVSCFVALVSYGSAPSTNEGATCMRRQSDVNNKNVNPFEVLNQRGKHKCSPNASLCPFPLVFPPPAFVSVLCVLRGLTNLIVFGEPTPFTHLLNDWARGASCQAPPQPFGKQGTSLDGYRSQARIGPEPRVVSRGVWHSLQARCACGCQRMCTAAANVSLAVPVLR